MTSRECARKGNVDKNIIKSIRKIIRKGGHENVTGKINEKTKRKKNHGGGGGV